MSLGYIRMLLRGTFHTRPTCAWEIVTMPLAIVIRCSDVTCLGGRKLAAYYKDAKTISYIHTQHNLHHIFNHNFILSFKKLPGLEVSLSRPACHRLLSSAQAWNMLWWPQDDVEDR